MKHTTYTLIVQDTDPDRFTNKLDAVITRNSPSRTVTVQYRPLSLYRPDSDTDIVAYTALVTIHHTEGA
jgi:hypothetical protein